MAVDLATKNLLHDKLRFAITVAGVAFAVTLVFTQVGLFLGLMDNATVTIEHIDADLWITSKNTPNIDFAHAFPETYVDRVRSIPGVDRADNLLVWFAQLSLPSGAQEATEVYALEDFSHWGIPWNVPEGDLSDLRRGPYMFLDESSVKRFGAFQVGDYREANQVRVKIIGRTRDARSFTTTPISFMDYRFMQSLLPQLLGNNTTYIVVKLAPGADREAVRAEIARRLPYNDVYTKAEWMSRSKRYWIENTGLGLQILVTVFLGCLVGIVIVAQTLYTNTMEHIKEFGTVKAIGGSNADIYRILGKQALISAVVGFVVGLGMSFAMAPLIHKLDLKMIIEPGFAGIVFMGTVIMCLLAATISFRKVASIDPALVFRT
jgi:putative ABC transport system permease protein